MGGQSLAAADRDLAGRRLEVRRGVRAMIDYEIPLTRRLVAGLGAFEGLTVHGITNPNAFARRVPTVSVSVAGRDPADLAQALAAEEIYVWSGHNYAVEPATALGLMDKGELRVAEKNARGDWSVNQWAKKAVLLSFRLNDMAPIKGGPGAATWWDKVPSKFDGWGENQWRASREDACQGECEEIHYFFLQRSRNRSSRPLTRKTERTRTP